MTLRYSITFLILVISIQAYSQVDFGIRKRKLKPTFFDTTSERVFVYEVPNALLYFKQDDIKMFIDNPKNKSILGNYGYKTFSDTVTKMTQRIAVTDYYFYYDEANRDSIFRQQTENPITKKLSEEFYFLGAGLILEGQFMVYSKADKKFITKGLVAKRRKEFLGQQTLQFYLPNKRQFYHIITRLGE